MNIATVRWISVRIGGGAGKGVFVRMLGTGWERLGADKRRPAQLQADAKG
jgi:hypothetical protein